MAPQVKGWQMSKNRRRSRFFWAGLETQRREQRAGMTEEAPRPQPWWLQIDHGDSSVNSTTNSFETGSMEEDSGTGSGDPFVTGNGSTGSTRTGSSAGGGANVREVLQAGFGEAQGILERNRMLIQEISQNKESSEAANGLARNVALAREFNTNAARAVDLYDNLSEYFALALAAKKAADAAAAGDIGGPKRPHSAGASSSGAEPAAGVTGVSCCRHWCQLLCSAVLNSDSFLIFSKPSLSADNKRCI